MQSTSGSHPPGRRDFMRASALTLAALPLFPVGCVGRSEDPPDERPQERSDPTDDDWIARARDQIPASTGTRYFQTGGIGPSPDAVIDEVKGRLDFQNRSPAAVDVSASMGEIEPALRSQLARVFGAAEREVALTHSTSEGISIVAWSLDWAPGDEVVISNQEHPANVVPWYVLRDRFGIVLREIDLDTGTYLLDEVRGALGPRTRMVSLPHVSRNNGRRIRTSDSAELAALLAAAGVRYHLDGAQGPGCVPVDIHALGCDCYSTCGHKWLLGPKGTGALFVRSEILDDVKLSWAGSHSHASMDYDGAYELLPTAARYEFGTRALADFAGFATAVTWMEDLGFDRVVARIDTLVDYAVDAVHEAGFTVSSPVEAGDRSGVFVIRLPEGCDATALYHALREEEGVLASPVRVERDFRLSIHFFNTTEEIDAAIAAIRARCP